MERMGALRSGRTRYSSRPNPLLVLCRARGSERGVLRRMRSDEAAAKVNRSSAAARSFRRLCREP